MENKTENLLGVPQGEFELNRLPKRSLELLRAWDAADEYLLNMLAEDIKMSTDARILILNDSFGALSIALSAFKPSAVSDSYLSQQATRLNLKANNLAEESVALFNSLEALEGAFDYVFIKATKTLALLEDQLIRLHPHLHPSTHVILAGMIKTLPAAIWKLLERLVGMTSTSLARKKARLIFVTPDPDLIIPENPYPVYYQLEGSKYLICNHANVFSRDSLDIGTRFFLQHLPQHHGKVEIVDLGCGNGLLGLIAAERNLEARVHFVDESFMAVESAKENFSRAFGVEREVIFTVGNGLDSFEAASIDVILCNPPFHQQNTIGDQIASSMIKESRRVLKKKGELWIVCNRHLNYHINLKQLFGNCTTVASNNKFVILKAVIKDI
jgi:16S rRNA (guanine1207-N2)-methyltransferase